MKNIFRISLFLSVFLLGISSNAQVHPSIQWKTMKLAHFDLIYDANHQDLAKHFAEKLEIIYSKLRPIFTDMPDRIAVVINDNTDQTNGYATPLPYSHIVTFPVLPDNQSTISEYGDWFYELLLHEYVHILNFEPRTGVVKYLHYAFGNVMTPNILLPRWWLEGIAVEYETRFSYFGRLRSSFQDAAIRALVKDDQLLGYPASHLNETSIHTWPQGARPYLLGSFMMSDIVAEKGTASIDRLMQRYGGRVPYIIDQPMRDEMLVNYSEHFENVKVKLNASALEKISKVKQNTPALEIGSINFPKSEVSVSALSPDGLRLNLIVKDETNKKAVKTLYRKTTDTVFNEKLVEGGSALGNDVTTETFIKPPKESGIDEGSDAPDSSSILRTCWFQDSKRFVYEKMNDINRFQSTYDLAIYNVETKKNEELVKGLRGREGCPNFSGTKIAFVGLSAGRTSLAIMSLPDKKITHLYQPEIGISLSTPIFVDDKNILFSERRDGVESLKVYDLDKEQTRKLSIKFANVPNPTRVATFRNLSRTKNGVSFTSTVSGAANVYEILFDSPAALGTTVLEAKAYTNSSTTIGGFVFDDFNSRLYFSELTSNGYQAFHLAKKSTQPTAIPPLLGDRYPSNRNLETNANSTNSAGAQTHEIEEYSSLGYLLPRYWLPSIGYGSATGLYLGASTSGFDPLMKHSYSLAATYESKVNDTSYLASYANQSFYPTLIATAFDLKLSTPITETQYRETAQSLTAVTDVPALSTDLMVGAGLIWDGRRYQSTNTYKAGYSVLAKYSNVSMSGAQISPESGGNYSYIFTEFPYSANQSPNRISYNDQKFVLEKYTSKFLPSRHVLLTRVRGRWTNQGVPLADHEPSLAAPLYLNLPSPYALMRAHPTSGFLSKNYFNYTAEYRFPISYLYRGLDTSALFVRRIHASLVLDGINADGYGYHLQNKTYTVTERSLGHYSGGAEMKFDITLGYQFGFTVSVGWYSTITKYLGENNQTYITFML